ncbi:site-specific integrase [Pantoea stewartii]|uniref:site-specific integrase n=1 Tax=Pantoea stewartii TaxID=66269 RepID=UPI00162A38E3|nr:site-specific integrase [Pantoea stewartii]MBC0853830.1 site-specific integrase [Pantoea stewartii]
MPIYKRGDTYWIDISKPDGTRIRRSAGTKEKEKAQQLHDKLKHEAWAVKNLDKRPERLFEDLIMLALRDAEDNANIDNITIYARYWLGVFEGRLVSSVSGEEITDNLPTHSRITHKRLSNATKNRYRAFVMRGFSLAYKSGWIDQIPYSQTLREPKVRIRWIDKGDARALVDNLEHQWMKWLCSFALLTGARLREILSLTWQDIDLGRRRAVIKAENAKSGRARQLPLSDEAVAILRQIPNSHEYVFSSDGRKHDYFIRSDFNRALRLTGIKDFRFHDLRHTWASWHVQDGTPLMVLKELGGWEKLEMVNKYAHLSGEHLSKFSGVVTFLAQKENDESTSGRISLVS